MNKEELLTKLYELNDIDLAEWWMAYIIRHKEEIEKIWISVPKNLKEKLCQALKLYYNQKG